MNKIKHLFILVCLSVLYSATIIAQNNTLSIPDTLIRKSQTLSLPIYMENTDDIVAMQFTLEFAEKIQIQKESVELSERANGHTITMRKVGKNNKYKLMIVSAQNTPFKGNKGAILSIPLTVADDAEDGEKLSILLNEVILTDGKGNNIVTKASGGSLTITYVDLAVTAVRTGITEISPKGKMTVNWTVENLGTISSTAGWKEEILLFSEDNISTLVGTTYYDNPLANGEIISRQADVILPEIMRMDGDASVQIKMIPYANAGEAAQCKDNNIAKSEVVKVNKQLFLNPMELYADESEADQLRYKLTRSGNVGKEETFVLTANPIDNRVTFPTDVTIKEGESEMYFFAQLSANGVLDDDSIVNLSISGNEYPMIESQLKIEDDTYPSLSISANNQYVNEGDTFQLTITTNRVSRSPIVVKLISENSRRFSIPDAVIIPAGESSVVVDVTAVDNDEIELEESIAFRVLAEKYVSGECLIVLNDNDMPTLSFTLSPEAVGESDGSSALFGVIKRTDNLDKRVTIKLSDDSNGLLTYSNQTVVMEKNQSEVQFNIGVKDNGIVDGNHTVNVTAAVYASSCDCSVPNDNKGSLTTSVTIIDDDGPSLNLKPVGTSMLEGSDNNIFAVSHNIQSDEDVIVRISSDKDDMLEYDHELTIPAGQSTVDLNIKVKTNETSDDSNIATFKVEAEGYAMGTCWILITDQTLPDAVVSLYTDKQEVEAEQTLLLRAIVKNVGNSALSSTTPLQISFSGAKETVDLKIGKSVPVGDSAIVEYNYYLPAVTGSHTFEAKVNAAGKIPELIYANNASEKVNISVLSPFSVTAQTDNDIYQQNDSVYISGTATGSAGKNAKIEVYLINEGSRQTVTTTSDEEGNYAVAWKPLSKQSGHFIVGACYPGSKATEEMDAFDVYGVRAKDNFKTCELSQTESFSGKIILTNPGNLAQTGLMITPKSESQNCEFSFEAPSVIGAGESIEIAYTVKANEISEGSDWQQMPVEITTAEGAYLKYIIYYYVHSLKARLQTNKTSINTTMSFGTPREYPVIIRNVGKTETGKITLALPNWIQAVTPSEMASLAQGDSATILLRFIPTEAMKLNVRISGRIGINCANGDGTSISFYLTPVSDAKGKLKVDVVDEYTYFTAEAPHVSKAKVSVKNPSTNEVVVEGETADDGTFTAEIPVGYYSVTVDADKHDSYANTVIVDPGVETEEEVFLSYQAITYSWNVEETGVEDEYEIETIVKYETRVPKPVVIITLPDEQPEPNSIIPVILTNKGLANAVDVNLSLSISNGYKLEFLNDPSLEVLAPQQAHVFYAKMVPESDEQEAAARARRASSNSSRCFTLIARAKYKELCQKYTGEELAEQIKKWGTQHCVSSGPGGSGGYGGYGPGYPGNWRNTNYDAYYKIWDTDDPAKFCDKILLDIEVNDPVNRNIVDDGEPERQPCGSQDEPVLVYKLVPVSGNRYEMNGVVADGVSQVKIVLDPDSSSIPEDDCENITDIKWKLSQERGQIEGNTLREAIYTAPDGLSTQYGASEFVEATVWYSQRTNESTTWGRHSKPVKIEIIRPPVLIVHGLFDDEDDWRGFEESLSPANDDNLYYKKNINYRLDYNSTQTHSLYENYPFIASGIRNIKHRALAQGYVANKCDVVGFGQGGILTRLYVQNGGRGINKIITMNTPHAGSEWADGIKGHNIIFGSILRLYLGDTNIDAIYDLGVNSSAINNLNAMSNLKQYNDIPVHAMATQNGVQSWVGTQGIGALFGIGGDIAQNFGPIGISVAVIAKYLGHFYTDDWSQVGIGDGYVSTASQVGGCTANTIQDWGYGHRDVPRNARFNARLRDLLLANKSESLFSNEWFSPEQRYFDHERWLAKIAAGEVTGIVLSRSGGYVAKNYVKTGDEVVYKYYDKKAEKTYEIMATELAVAGGMNAGSFISSAGEYIRQNSEVEARSVRSIKTTDNGEKYLFFNLNKLNGYSEPLIVVSYGEDSYVMDEGYDVDIKVPSTFTGEANILVFMKDNDENVLYQDYIYTIEEPMAKPVSLHLEEMCLNINEREPLRLYCTWSDGSETKVVPEQITFSHTSVATFVDNGILGLNSGLTNASVIYRGLSCEGLIRVFATDDDEDSDDSPSICSTVTLSFKQKNVMTRQAFRGTLTVNNGNETTAMKDVKMNLEVRDMDGNLTTSHEFQIDAESLNGFTGNLDFTSGWTLGAGETGSATILFIPTKYAAPTEPKDYSFGGSFSYTDPYTGLTVTRDLNPVTLTVNPSPNLEMTYFMQRDVFGDDPLTETVEPMMPSEFALIVNNKGYGDAENMSLTTHQPEIIDNQKGLAINFELISTQLNGGETNLSLGGSMTSDFGTIPAHSQAYAQWWLQSSLLGHFIEYDVKATHLTSRNNPDLSLLDTVTIHELIHGFMVNTDGDKPLRGFLVNDIKDKNDTPDYIYFTDATQQEAYMVSEANIVKQSDTEYVLKVKASTAGWNYGSLLDPTYGKQKLVKVTRSDGTEVNVDNIWQTDRTLRDGKDWLYENRLHFIGNMSAEGETFHLTFEPKPEVELQVEGYSGIPEEGTVQKEQLTEVTVKFNKPIKAETFTTEDITLNCQGIAQDASQIVIEPLNEQEYKLKLNEVTLLDGYYVLTVQTAGIEDTEGFNGSTGKQATWIQFVDGKVALKITASPKEGGTVSMESGLFDYGSEMILNATPSEGYEFVGWYNNGEAVSSQAEFIHFVNMNTELTAKFVAKNYLVTFYDDDRTTVLKQAIQNYGSEIIPPETPAKEGNTFVGWGEVDQTVPAHEVEYFAKYNVNKYKVTYIIDGQEYAVDSVAYGESIPIIDVPIRNGHEFNNWGNVPNFMPAYDLTLIGSYTLICNQGDVNNDGIIVVDDVVLTINAVMGHDSDNFVFEAADMNGDGQILVDDVVLVIKAVLNSDNSNVAKVRGTVSGEEIALNANGNGFGMSVSNASAYSALQFDMIIPAGVNMDEIRVKQGDNHMVFFQEKSKGVVRAVVISLTNEPFTGNDLLDVKIETADEEVVLVTNACMVTRNGSVSQLADASVAVGGNYTDITEILNGTEKADIYDLSGRMVKKGATTTDGLLKGVYLVNGKKVVLK